MYDLILKNGHCFLPGAVEKKVDVAILNGKIKKIEENILENSKEVLDVSGLHIFPGIIDTQVHFREPGLTHKEDLESGSQSAVLGGVTTFFEMPNTSPPTTTRDAINQKIEIALEKSWANFAFYIGASGKNIEELKLAQGLDGICGVKIFLGSSTGDLLLYNQEKLVEIFENLDCPVAVHSESEDILNSRMSIRDNATHPLDHPKWRNVDSALKSTEMILEIAKKANRKVHVLHITTKEEIELLKKNKDHCTVEVTPQHLTLSSPDCYNKLGTYAQMNPPIREKDHQDGLWEGIYDGTVDVIGSDHAPHTKAEKDQGYPKSPSGMPGVQTIFPIMLDHALNKKITKEKLVELLCEAPARLYKLNKGKIEIEKDADFTIVDLAVRHTILDKDMKTKSGWTPFHHKEVKGKVIHTIVNGDIAVKDSRLNKRPKVKPISKQ